jgi:hypothetical protein
LNRREVSVVCHKQEKMKFTYQILRNLNLPNLNLPKLTRLNLSVIIPL